MRGQLAPGTAAGRLRTVLLAAVLAVWCILIAAVALTYQTPGGGSPWPVRWGILSVGAAVAGGVIGLAALLGRRIRTLAARPLPEQGVSRWLARQPGWRLALLCWVCYAVTADGAIIGVSLDLHRGVPVIPLVGVLYTSAILAVAQAAMTRAISRRRGARLAAAGSGQDADGRR